MAREIADHPKRPRGRRVTAVALGLLGVLDLGLGLGSASQVTLAASPLGAGATTIAPCQGSAPITAAFTTGWYTSGTDSYRATRVRLTGINAACNGRAYQFRVVTTTGYLNPEETGTVSGGVTQNETITTTPVANIVSVVVVIP
jgi:hypothetical protein